MCSAKVAYISFDILSVPKGAATHIRAFVPALAAAFGEIELVTVSEDADTKGPSEYLPGVRHTELPAIGATLIDRALCFRRHLVHWLRNREFAAIQFRSIFEGLPLLDFAGRARLIFEVNGLPSIELKYRYPGAEDDRELMNKVNAQEQACLEGADLIVTPSRVTRDYLVSERSVRPEKVKVIANGVDIDLFQPTLCRVAIPARLLYFGTLSTWQGVELCIRALAQLIVETPAELTIVGIGSGRDRDDLTTLAAKLNVASLVTVMPPVPQRDLAAHVSASDIVLVPLTLTDRNVVQGCCPLKILEGMAAGVPVIASDLPVVRELGCDGTHFLLVKPGSVDQITEAALRLINDRALAANIGRRAREHVVANHTWDRSGSVLVSSYEKLGISRPSIA